MALFSAKKNKVWIFKALNRANNKSIAWVVGGRNKKTLQSLYEKLSHLKATYYTDGWKTFAKVIPFDRHVVGKKHTCRIESNNANTRHQLGRMIHRLKVVSKSITMIHLTLKLWHYYSIDNNFIGLRDHFLSIF